MGEPSSPKLSTDIKFETRKYADYGTVEYHSTGEDTGDMVLVYPVKFKASQFSGTIDFGLKVSMTKSRTEDGKNMWRLDLNYQDSAKLTDFKCAIENCDGVAKYLITELASEVITHKN
jgi:hypothetical protein